MALHQHHQRSPTRNTMVQEKSSTTMVRMAVATVESVLRMPHLASTVPMQGLKILKTSRGHPVGCPLLVVLEGWMKNEKGIEKQKPFSVRLELADLVKYLTFVSVKNLPRRT